MRYPPTTYSSISYQRLSDMHSQAIQWLWQGWLALGKLAILEGDPGLGKSLVTLDLCARLTTGRTWPDAAPESPKKDPKTATTPNMGTDPLASKGLSPFSERCPDPNMGTDPLASKGLSPFSERYPGTPCNVVILNAEDNMQDTVRPRLQALGGDSERVFHLAGVVDRKGEESIRFPAHALALRDLVQQTQAKLVVIDPFVSFLDRSVYAYLEQSVRGVLGLLKELAEEQQCAILLVRHLNKSDRQHALYRGGASIGFLAAVRCVWLVAADPQQPGRRVLAQLKNNLGALAPSLSFEICEQGDSPEWH